MSITSGSHSDALAKDGAAHEQSYSLLSSCRNGRHFEMMPSAFAELDVAGVAERFALADAGDVAVDRVGGEAENMASLGLPPLMNRMA